MLDLYMKPGGLDVLLQRTVVTSRDNDAPLPVCNNARPPQRQGMTMKRKNNPGFFVLATFLVFVGFYICFICFILDPFGASFYYSIFFGGSIILQSLVMLETRTSVSVLRWKKASPHFDTRCNEIIIYNPSLAYFIRNSGVFFINLSLGLAPWFFPGVFFRGSTFLSPWHLISLFFLLPSCVYVFVLATASQTFTVSRDRKFFKFEQRGICWSSELISSDPQLDIDVNPYDYTVDFIVRNADYMRKSIFGNRKSHVKEKKIPIPDTRNVSQEEFLPQLFPEQVHLMPLMFDLTSMPRYGMSRTKKAEKIRKELTRRQQEFRRDSGRK